MTTRGTHAYDYRNTPSVEHLLNREAVILSARGMLVSPQVNLLLEARVRPYFLLQPNVMCSGGVPLGTRPGDDRTFPWDTLLVNLALNHSALMMDDSGAWLDMFNATPTGSILLDFRNPKFIAEYAALLVETFPKAAGIVLDYGCPWIPVEVPDWEAWRAGWIEFLAEVKRLRPNLELIAQCDNPVALTLPSNGQLFEHVGSALNPPARTFETSLALWKSDRRPFFRQEWTDPQTRRFFAATAIMFDGAFDQCADPNQVPPLHYPNVEHFKLAVGYGLADPWERWPGVWQRMTSRGLVIVNVSKPLHTFKYDATRSFVIPAGDALVIQNKDANGRRINPITNANR